MTGAQIPSENDIVYWFLKQTPFNGEVVSVDYNTDKEENGEVRVPLEKRGLVDSSAFESSCCSDILVECPAGYRIVEVKGYNPDAQTPKQYIAHNIKEDILNMARPVGVKGVDVVESSVAIPADAGDRIRKRLAWCKSGNGGYVSDGLVSMLDALQEEQGVECNVYLVGLESLESMNIVDFLRESKVY
jgi:hypothetical protein